MKTYILRAITLILTVILLLSLCPVTMALEMIAGTNSASDTYAESEYYEKLSSIKLTGDGRTDLIAVALSQLGYTEGNEHGDFGGKTDGTLNYTEYNYNMGSFGSGYGGKEYPWCASFVSFCLLQAGTHEQTKVSDWCRKHEGDPEYIWREVSCNKWAKQLRECGYFEDSASFGGTYMPIPGDLIYFTEDRKLESHIGIVLYCDSERVYTIEGNTTPGVGLDTNGDGVYTKSYALTSSYIRGYGVLPYEVNNEVRRIDYSGQRPEAGVYVATITKFVYLTETASTYDYLLPKYSLFTVTEVAEGGRLKGIFNIGGKEIVGYVKNNEDRVIQLSSLAKNEDYTPISEAWGYVHSSVDGYFADEHKYAERPEDLGVSFDESSLGIEGRICLSREVVSVGYYIDNDKDNTVFDDSAINEMQGQEERYTISLSASVSDVGTHTVHFVARIADGEICEIETLKFTSRNKNDTVPVSPTLESFGESTITLTHREGYEYKLGGAEWQSSNVFSGLDSSAQEPYIFYQRLAQTDLLLPSEISEALEVDLKKLNDSSKLTSLSVEGFEISPVFTPNVFEYTLRVPYPTEEIEVLADANELSVVTVTAPPLGEGEETIINILVEGELSSTREYAIRVFRDEKPPETTTVEQESASDTVDSAPTDLSIGDISCASALSLPAITMILGLSLVAIKKKKE